MSGKYGNRICPSSENAYMLRVSHIRLRLRVDSEVALQQLLDYIGDRKPNEGEARLASLAERNSKRLKNEQALEARLTQHGDITVPYLLKHLREALPERTTIVNEVSLHAAASSLPKSQKLIDMRSGDHILRFCLEPHQAREVWKYVYKWRSRSGLVSGCCCRGGLGKSDQAGRLGAGLRRRWRRLLHVLHTERFLLDG